MNPLEIPIEERRKKLEEMAVQEALEFKQAFKNLKNKKKKVSWRRRLTGTLAALVACTGFHVVNPVWSHTLKYLVTDTFTETAQEKQLEEKFGISYFGTKNSGRLESLEKNLDEIKRENPALLKHLNMIILYDLKDLTKKYTNVFLYFDGRAMPGLDCVELCGTSRDTLIHELAHILDFNTSDEFDEKIAKIHNHSIGEDLKKDWSWYKLSLPSRWKDGKRDPRHGQLRPYGANSLGETVATYVETGFSPYRFNGLIEDSTKYVQTIDLLEEYEFLTPIQAEKFRTRIKSKCPSYIREIVLEEIAKLTPPKFIGEESAYYSNREKYYESEKLTIDYYSGMHGRSISLTFKISEDNQINFSVVTDWQDKKIKLSEGAFKDRLNDYFPQEAYDKFKELGYEKLLNWQEKEKIKERTK